MGVTVDLWCLLLAGVVVACGETNSTPAGAQSADDAGSSGFVTKPQCPNSQVCYTYPGCPVDDGLNDEPCPSEVTIACAVETIRARHASCTASSDCVAGNAYPPSGCSTVWACGGPVVNAAEAEAFTREAQAEFDRYCAKPACGVWVGCPEPLPGTKPACVNGACVWDYGDGGLGDAAAPEDASDAGQD